MKDKNNCLLSIAVNFIFMQTAFKNVLKKSNLKNKIKNKLFNFD